MDDDLERVLGLLQDAAERARHYRFELTDAYLALIEQVEAMPQNQSGADKGCAWIGSLPEARRQHALVRRAPNRP